jgi:CheY-like chemotaxis protein
MRRERRWPRVLVVDHDPSERAVLESALLPFYDVRLACDAVQAVRLARLTIPDIVLLDYALPAGDAPLVVERLRAIPELERIPVILVSDWSQGWSWDDLLEMEAAFVPKPVEQDSLVDEIERALAAA